MITAVHMLVIKVLLDSERKCVLLQAYYIYTPTSNPECCKPQQYKWLQYLKQTFGSFITFNTSYLKSVVAS